jgi:hypothetical protein
MEITCNDRYHIKLKEQTSCKHQQGGSGSGGGDTAAQCVVQFTIFTLHYAMTKVLHSLHHTFLKKRNNSRDMITQTTPLRVF